MSIGFSCLFVLGVNSGLRISDLLKLRISDITEKGKIKDRIRLREKKTNKFKDFPCQQVQNLHGEIISAYTIS